MTTISGFTGNGFADPEQNHCNYLVNIPNIVGYPEHKRCLIQVQSLSVHGDNDFKPNPDNPLNPVYVGVKLDGVAVQSCFSTSGRVSNEQKFGGVVSDSSLIGQFTLDARGLDTRVNLGYGFDNPRSILDDGVLASSPFGKQIRVQILNLTSKDVLDTNATNNGVLKHVNRSKNIKNNPTHVTLRLLFLDDDEIPMR